MIKVYKQQNFHRQFLILYYNKFPIVCDHMPKSYCSKKEIIYNKLHVVICVTPALDKVSLNWRSLGHD